jgi:hypothetical protein
LNYGKRNYDREKPSFSAGYQRFCGDVLRPESNPECFCIRSFFKPIKVFPIYNNLILLKHEANVILKPILNDIKKLKAGFEFFIGGKFNIFYGTQSEFSLSSGEVCATLQTSLIDTSVYTNKYLKTSSGERL